MGFCLVRRGFSVEGWLGFKSVHECLLEVPVRIIPTSLPQVFEASEPFVSEVAEWSGEVVGNYEEQRT